jgi:hypothetical protein
LVSAREWYEKFMPQERSEGVNPTPGAK